MVDFRKLLLAFALIALVLGTGVPALAQNPPQPFTCSAGAANPPLVRAEGVTEQVGDVQIICVGGTSTTPGNPIPLSNIQVTMTAGVTDRIYSDGTSEAFLIMDDAYPATPDPTQANGGTPPAPNAAHTQLACNALGGNGCEIFATGAGATGLPGGDYDGAAGHYNVFRGFVSGPNAITFLGVPIDAPGTNGNLTIRITGVRIDANQLGVGSSSFSQTTIPMAIAINGQQQVTISNPNPTVGYVVPGLVASVTPDTEEVCLAPSAGFIMNFTEAFAASFKARLYGDGLAQNIPGFSYNSESGLFDTAGVGSPALGPGGLADHGTKLLARFTGFPAGVTLTVPAVVGLTSNGVFDGGFAYYVTTDGFGNSPPGNITPLSGGIPVPLDATGAGWVTYEIRENSPNAVETASIGVSVSYTIGSVSPGAHGLVSLSFGPIPGSSSYTSTGWLTAESPLYPIPRFVDTGKYDNLQALSVVPCTCNLLFPFLTNQAGFDTGVAIANTSVDPFGTLNQTGPIVLNYYGQLTGGVALTTAQQAVTTPSIPAGCILTFTLSGGGAVMNCANGPTDTIPATAGFQGYLIAQAQFQFCHGYAFITDMGAQRLAEGYLALQLDGSPNYTNPFLGNIYNFNLRRATGGFDSNGNPIYIPGEQLSQ